jgi:hypothetical protein
LEFAHSILALFVLRPIFTYFFVRSPGGSVRHPNT